MQLNSALQEQASNSIGYGALAPKNRGGLLLLQPFITLSSTALLLHCSSLNCIPLQAALCTVVRFIDGVLDQVGGGAGRATLVGSYCAGKRVVNKY